MTCDREREKQLNSTLFLRAAHGIGSVSRRLCAAPAPRPGARSCARTCAPAVARGQPRWGAQGAGLPGRTRGRRRCAACASLPPPRASVR
jgi:hypothetical protein